MTSHDSVNIMAFDLSLTSSGWADGSGCGVIVPPEGAERGIRPVQAIRDHVLERAQFADVVVIEGYAFAAKGRAVISLGELGGAVRCALSDLGVPWCDVPPTCRAMYATGRGNAGKAEVLAAAIRSFQYAGHSFDEADALFLRSMALEHYLPSGARLTDKQRKALASVDWPTIEQRREAA